jgi:hypothetical protein
MYQTVRPTANELVEQGLAGLAEEDMGLPGPYRVSSKSGSNIKDTLKAWGGGRRSGGGAAQNRGMTTGVQPQAYMPSPAAGGSRQHL